MKGQQAALDLRRPVRRRQLPLGLTPRAPSTRSWPPPAVGNGRRCQRRRRRRRHQHRTGLPRGDRVAATNAVASAARAARGGDAGGLG